MSADGAPLVLAAHGTADPHGQAVIADLADLVRAALPGTEVRLAWVDVIEPTLESVLRPGDVVVPCFLGSGYHVHVDIPAAISSVAGVRATAAFGPAPQVVAAVADRLRQAAADAGAPGVPAAAALTADDPAADDPAADNPGTAIVLGAAGSSDPRSRAETETAARELSTVVGHPVTAGYLSAARPTVAEAVGQRRAEGHPRVWVASYLLAPGFFQQRLHAAGADLVSAPIGAHRRVVDLIVQRYLRIVQRYLAG